MLFVNEVTAMCKSSKLSKLEFKWPTTTWIRLERLLEYKRFLKLVTEMKLRMKDMVPSTSALKEMLKVHQEVLELVVCQIYIVYQLQRMYQFQIERLYWGLLLQK